MRKLVLVLVSALALACGGSDSGGGTPSAPVLGTVGGRAFSPAEVRAVVVGSGQAPCTIATQTLGVKALALELTSYANACGDFTAATCPARSSPQAVTILFARLNGIPPFAEPTIAPGTYTISTKITDALPDSSGLGQLYLAFAEAAADGATCASPPAVTGTLRLDSVTGPITGHVAVTFASGGSIAGDFSAPICPGVTPEVCALATAPALCALPPACTSP
jgi:hypothetical protein